MGTCSRCVLTAVRDVVHVCLCITVQGNITVLQVLQWVMNNTVESTQMGLVQWTKQGLDYAYMKGYPGEQTRHFACTEDLHDGHIDRTSTSLRRLAAGIACMSLKQCAFDFSICAYNTGYHASVACVPHWPVKPECPFTRSVAADRAMTSESCTLEDLYSARRVPQRADQYLEQWADDCLDRHEQGTETLKEGMPELVLELQSKGGQWGQGYVTLGVTGDQVRVLSTVHYCNGLELARQLKRIDATALVLSLVDVSHSLTCVERTCTQRIKC